VPYIKQEDRKPIDKYLDGLIVLLANITNAGKKKNGQVVYVIYKLIKEIYADGNFEIKSNALKVLDSASKEYYRKIMIPYEDSKIESNGDV